MNLRKQLSIIFGSVLGLIILTGCKPDNYEITECQFDDYSGKNIECGYLSVPEDRSREDSPIIKLRVAVIKSRNKKPERDPLVIFQG